MKCWASAGQVLGKRPPGLEKLQDRALKLPLFCLDFLRRISSKADHVQRRTRPLGRMGHDKTEASPTGLCGAVENP